MIEMTKKSNSDSYMDYCHEMNTKNGYFDKVNLEEMNGKVFDSIILGVESPEHIEVVFRNSANIYILSYNCDNSNYGIWAEYINTTGDTLKSLENKPLYFTEDITQNSIIHKISNQASDKTSDVDIHWSFNIPTSQLMDFKKVFKKYPEYKPVVSYRYIEFK